MEVAQAFDHLQANLALEIGKFYAPSDRLSLGVGKIYRGVRYPIFDESRALFQTVAGFVLVLTHECDVDQANARLFNDHVLICPLIPFEKFVASYLQTLDENALKSFLANLGRRFISRVLYIPTFANMPYGALMYLNQITSTHISAFQDNRSDPICATTAYGLQIVDYVLQNHLLRPKSERLALDSSR